MEECGVNKVIHIAEDGGKIKFVLLGGSKKETVVI